MASRLSIAERGERLVYRIAGLPVAISAALAIGDARKGSRSALDAAFAQTYWHPDNAGEWMELAAALLTWPIALVAGALWFTARNGEIIRRRTGKGIAAQMVEQLRLYFRGGILAPWYYIFALHDEGDSRVATFIQRFETKTCYFRLLKQRKGSPLNDKARFARHCANHGIRCVETIVSLDGMPPGAPLPEQDLFVKPAKGRGGRGAERWDHVGPSRFAGPQGELDAAGLLQWLVARSRHQPLIVQPRLKAHSELIEITAGALPTARVLTCLDEGGEPEVVAAMLRTSFGTNRTVDNLHAGGIGALIDIASGTLSKASNLGSDARLGWISAHPDTGGRIEGRRLPFWEEVKTRALEAHRAFADRIVIGWDVSILEDGPIIIEGNGNPDLDILQRFMRTGLRQHRFGDLLGHHLDERARAKGRRLSAASIAA